MDNYKHLCPVCKDKGITTFLQLRQINLSTAVYLCKDIRCEYPTGHSWIYEDRNLSDIDDDDSDSDLSDIVNDDIEKMKLTISYTFDLYAHDVDIPTSNNSITRNFNSASSVPKNEKKHVYEPLQFKDSTNKNNERKSCEKIEDTLYSSNVENIKAIIHDAEPCVDVGFVESTEKVENVINNDTNELSNSLDLPCDTSVAKENYTIVATDAKNTDAAVPENTAQIQIKYEMVKNQTDPNTFKIDIKMPNLVQDDKVRENEINIPVLKNNLKKKFVVLNAKTGVDKLNEIPQKHAEKINELNLSDSMLKNVSKLNILKKVNPNKIQNVAKICENVAQSKTQNEDSLPEVLQILKNTRNDDSENLESRNIVPIAEASTKNDSNVKISGVKTRSQEKHKDLLLPFANVEFKPVYKTKLNLSSRRNKPQYHIPESAVEDAIQTLQNSEPKKKKVVQIISGKNNTKTPTKKSADSFEGFRFSTKVIKPATNGGKSKLVDPLDQLELKNFLKSAKRKKGKQLVSKCESDEDEDIFNTDVSDTSNCSEKIETTNVNDKTNSATTNVNDNDNVHDKTNLGLGDLTLNEILDDMNDLNAVNVPNSTADIAEVDDWLNSLCQ